MTVAVKQGARLRAGRYELERLLGRGGAASVWLARDTLLERPVAIKLLSEGLAADQDWMTRFRREARIAARLQHPNLVSIYDFESEVERPYLVMAYLPGGTLASRLEHGGCPDTERLARDVLGALGHIHDAGIIHRDVKPANVLLDRDGRACLTDFGIARPEDATSITQTGHIPGTARYMAPELWRGEAATERSDLFSCGVLLSQCVSDDDEASGRMLGLVERLAAESPELRPESAAAALALLDRRTSGREAEPERTATTAVVAPVMADFDREPTPAEATEPPTPSEPSRPVHSAAAPRRWPAIAGLAAVLLAATIALASSLGGDDPASDNAATTRAGGEPDKGNQQQAAAADGSQDSPSTAAPPEEPVTDPVALNDQGFELIAQGRYDEAIPILEQAVAGLEGSGDLTYAYALYNLGHALRLAGRPAEAIPILEQRLEIPNQTGTVAAELELAREEAGVSSGGGDEDKPAKPEKESKPEKD